MQMMADVLNMPIKIVKSQQACALGAAIFGAVASKTYPNTFEAMNVMGSPFENVYEPIAVNVPEYQKIYKKYGELALIMEDYTMKTI